MDAIKVLTLLENDDINEAKEYLREVIFLNQKSPSEKSRYSAMKRFIKYATMFGNVDFFKYPNSIQSENIFISSVSIVSTKESIGELKSWNDISHKDVKYPTTSVEAILNQERGTARKVDIRKLLVEASTKGYKIKKQEFLDYKFIVKVDGYFYKLVNLDCAYSIIADDSIPDLYISKDRNMVMIQTKVGCAYILRLERYGEINHVGKVVYNINDFTIR